MATRVVLDTSAVRALIYGDAQAEPLVELHNHLVGLSVALANNVVPELVVALHQGRIDWHRWASRVGLVDRLLDPVSPIFPNDQELARVALGGDPRPQRILSVDEHSRQIWILLRNAKGAPDLERGTEFTGSDGIVYQLVGSQGLAETLAQGHRSRWMRMTAELQAQIVVYSPSQEHIAELQFTKLFGGHPDEGTLRRRHDGSVRSLARFVSLALNSRSTYRASGPTRRGDSFDVELLTALAAPALVCTLDGRLRRHVEESGSVQAKQLLTPYELLNALKNGTWDTYCV